MDTIGFLEWLYGETPIGYLTLWRKSDNRTFWYSASQLKAMAEVALDMAHSGADVYYGVGVRKEKLEKGRGKNEDILAVPALWVDIDIADPSAHKQEKLPQDIETALDFLKSLPITPSGIINSGYGLHAYWKLEAPLEMDTPNLHDQALKLMRGWQRFVNEQAAERGWKLDSVHDAARVLRVPGTLNYKQQCPRNVEVLEVNKDQVYSIEVFEEYRIPSGTKASEDNPGQYEEIKAQKHGMSDCVIRGCAFIRHCIADAVMLPEPEWHGMVNILAHCQDGTAAVHDVSRPYLGYSMKETQAKIDRALKENKPHTCEYIKQHLGFPCPEHGCGVKSPIGLASGRHSVLWVVQGITKETAFDKKVIEAAAIVRRDYPAEWGQLREKIKSLRVDSRDFERAVKKAESDLPLQFNETTEQIEATLDHYWPVGDKHKDLRLPMDGWKYSAEGIDRVKYLSNRAEALEWVSRCPVFFSGRIHNTDSHGERLELSFYRDGKWSKILAPRSHFYEKRKLIELGNYGLLVTSNTAERLIQYLGDFERLNHNDIPLIKAVSQMGWINSKEFMWGPNYGGNLVLDIDSGSSKWASGYHESGTLTEWKINMQGVRKHPIARLMLAGSFAAPLLKLLKLRTIFLHCWGPSQGGKTAALKAALSNWGDPEKIMTSFNATPYAIEQFAGFYNDLPLGIDERQVAGNNQEAIDKLVYSLSQGQGKARGMREGGIRPVVNWRSIILTTGEEALSTESSAGGIKTRAIELYGLPFGNDDELAASIHSKVSDTYGTAGPEYIRRLMNEDVVKLREIHREWVKKVKEIQPLLDGSHALSIAGLLLADVLSSIWIWDIEIEQATQEAENLLKGILVSIEISDKAGESGRAYDYLMGWININEQKFRSEAIERFGAFNPAEKLVYIFPPALDRALKDGGFNPKRIKRDWAVKNIILKDRQGKGSINVKGKRVVAIRLGEYGHEINAYESL